MRAPHPVASSFSAILLFIAGTAFGQTSEPTDVAAPKTPREALERIDTGIDLTLQPGVRWFGSPTLAGFSGDGAGSDFGAGLGIDLGASFRFASEFSVGAELGFHGYGAANGADVTQYGSNTYKLTLRMSRPLNPFWVEVNAGLGTFTASSTIGGAASVSAALLGGKLGVQFAPIPALPGLSFGAFAGLEGWFTNQLCAQATPQSTQSCAAPAEDGAINLGVVAGLSVRYVIPLGYVAPPPKPATATYLLVKSRLQVATSERSDAEVTDTPEYRQALAKVRRVALSAPDYCASKTAADTTGQAAHTDSVVQTKCGVEMSEIERALTRQGYSVQSWLTLQAMVREQRMTARDAAARLGAQVLFQVNSLEHVKAQPSTNARWERAYYASDEFGTEGQRVQPGPQDLSSLQQLMQQPELAALPGQTQGAMLDVNAILVESGQTIWFYRWQRLDTSSSRHEVSVLAKRMSDELVWQPAIPTQKPGTFAPYQPGDSATFEAAGGPSNATDALYFQLMRDVVADFVARFSHPLAQ